jgi:hypothetical protein
MCEIPTVPAKAVASHVPVSVRFAYRQEFSAELARDKLGVHRGIVRVTGLYRPAATEPHDQVLSVLAGYLVDAGDGALQLVELDCRCEPMAGGDQHHTQAPRAEEVIGALEQATADAGLESRPGRFVVAAGKSG